MAQKMKIKKGDSVHIIAGKDKGRSGQVLRVWPKEGRLLVEGVQMVKRHQRQTANEQGGIIHKEAPIHVSNVMLQDPKENGKGTRVGFRFEEGKKLRFAKRSGEIIEEGDK